VNRPTVIVDLINNKLTDDCFTLEVVEPNITWNISRIRRDAESGKFGPPGIFDMRGVPAPNYECGNLDLRKIEAFKTKPAILAIPVIGIGDPRGGVLCIADGQHRLTSRWELALPDFSMYIVPHEIEKKYRLLEVLP